MPITSDEEPRTRAQQQRSAKSPSNQPGRGFRPIEIKLVVYMLRRRYFRKQKQTVTSRVINELFKFRVVGNNLIGVIRHEAVN